jgi:hypothetical protein
LQEILIATLDQAGFERAQSAIDVFQQHDSYEDYRCDREGRLLGLAFAGQGARLVPVSIDHFLTWSASTGEPPTAARLDAFVALIEAFRRDPKARPGPFLGTDAVSESAVRRDSLSFPVDSGSYRDWLACLGESSPESLLCAYAGLLAEAWTDRPRLSTLVK